MNATSTASMWQERRYFKHPDARGSLLPDVVGASLGGVFATSTIAFVESASGLSIFPAIPSFSTALALIIIGFLRMTSVAKMDFAKSIETCPHTAILIASPFMYGILKGSALDVISCVVINWMTGYAKKINLLKCIY